MNLQKLAFIGVIIFLITFNIRSQNDYKPGYIINCNSDTIRGFINLRANYNNCKSCEFKKELTSQAETFLPSALIAYRFENGRYYISKEISLDSIKKKVFLEYLLNGIANLYYYKVFTNEYYFIEKDNSMYLLTNEMVNFGHDHIRNSNKFRGILKYVFRDCPEISGEIDNTNFEYKSFIKVSKDYHNKVCRDFQCIEYAKPINGNIILEPGFAIISSRMGLNTSKDHSGDIKPSFGISLRFKPAKVRSLFNFVTGVNFSTNSFKGDFANSLNGDGTFHRLIFRYSILRIPLSVEYSFLSNRIQPYVSISYINAIILNQFCDARLLTEYQNKFYPGALLSARLQKYQCGLAPGVGLRFKIKEDSEMHLKIEYEYRLPPGKNNIVTDYHYTESLIYSLSYSFKL